MKKIKFRAWDKENDFMFYSENNYPISKYNLGFDFMGRNEFRLMMLIDIEESLFKEVDADIMQYTGFKDMDDREIYEGDILDYGAYGEFEVVWCKGAFKIRKIDFQNANLHLLSSCYFDELEVIGNIYETQSC